jgi:hypothetical protein
MRRLIPVGADAFTQALAALEVPSMAHFGVPHESMTKAWAGRRLPRPPVPRLRNVTV